MNKALRYSVVTAFGVGVLMLLMSRVPGVDLFHIGLGTPASSLVQILLCVGYYWYLNRRKPVRQ